MGVDDWESAAPGSLPHVLQCGSSGAVAARSSLPISVDSAALASYPAFVFILLLSYSSCVPSISISLTEAASRENKHEQQ